MTWFRFIFSNLSFSAISTSILLARPALNPCQILPCRTLLAQCVQSFVLSVRTASGCGIFWPSSDGTILAYVIRCEECSRSALNVSWTGCDVMWWTWCEPLVNRLKTLSGWAASQNRNRTSKFCWHLIFLSQRVFSPPRELHVYSSGRNQSLILEHQLCRLQQEVLQMHRQIIFG